jgi:hypothetical protein
VELRALFGIDCVEDPVWFVLIDDRDEVCKVFGYDIGFDGF